MKTEINTNQIKQNAPLLFLICYSIPFITFIIVFLLGLILFLAPFLLIGFVIFLRNKNARKSRVLQLAKNMQESKQKIV